MITVETGQGLPDAVSYVCAEDATTYHALFGNTAWAEATDKQEPALVRATQAVDIIWGSKFISRQATKQQALAFPRLGFYDNNSCYVAQGEIPKRLKDAVCEMALYYITNGELIAVDTNQGIQQMKQKIGDLEEQVTYSKQSLEKGLAEKYSKVDLLLKPIVFGPSFGITL